MRHTISTTIVNKATGTAGSEDGVMMLVVEGIAASAGTQPVALDTAYLLSKIDDLTGTYGITEDYDYVNGLSVYQQVKEFYDQAGDGAYLWLVLKTKNSSYTTYCASDTFKALIRGTISSDNTKNPKMVGVCYAPPATQQHATDFNADVLTLIAVLQSTQEDMFDEGFGFSCIVDGANMSSTATANTLQTMANKQAPSVSLCITGSKPDGVAAVGAALGRFSSITIGHGFGATNDGAVEIASAYLTNGVVVSITGTVIEQGSSMTAAHEYMVVKGPVTYNSNSYSVGETFVCQTGSLTFTGTGTTVVDLTATGTVVPGSVYYVVKGPITYNSKAYATGSLFTAVTGVTTFVGGIASLYLANNVANLAPADVNTLGDKQYMFLRTYFKLSGLYWNDGGTCDLATKPLSYQEFNRVANYFAASVLMFIEEYLIGQNVPIDKKTNLVAASFTNALIEDFTRIYIEPKIVSKDISSGDMTLVGTPNGSNTVDWTYTLTIGGTPITGSVTGTVQFT